MQILHADCNKQTKEAGLISPRNLDYYQIIEKMSLPLDNEMKKIFTNASTSNNQGIDMPVVGAGARLEH